MMNVLCLLFFFLQKLSSISNNSVATVIAFCMCTYTCVYMREGKEKQRDGAKEWE